MSTGKDCCKYALGIDVGSVSVKIVTLDSRREIVQSGYWPTEVNRPASFMKN
jgi:activator of 2-hydroxyglutaryl-CoA dehydratase